MNKFTHFANEVLNDYLSKATNYRFIDGEARTRIYVQLKRSNELNKLFEHNGELQLSNEFIYKLLEHYINAHEGAWGENDDNNKSTVYNALKIANTLHLLFEEHYSYEVESLL